MVGCNEGQNDPIKKILKYLDWKWCTRNIKCPLGFWLNYLTKESEGATRIRMSKIRFSLLEKIFFNSMMTL